MSFARKLPFGATLLPTGGALFRLWAPEAEFVHLLVDGLDPQPMRRAEGGWFELEAVCGEGDRYRFRLPDGLCVPDPASRAQDGDVHDASIIIDPRAYTWNTPGWRGRPWEEAIVYELHVGLLGGFRGVAERLPALADLGVTAVELMPIGDFPGPRNWGYDGVLPFAPDAAYGTPDELKALVDRAHELGLMVILDVVYNHFGPDGNYLHSYAPAFFDEGTHTPWGAAIDFDRPEVRRFFTENALYWLMEYRFDGLRLDAVHAIKDPGWIDEMAATVRREVEPGRLVHLILENERNEPGPLARNVDAQWNDDIHHCLHVLLTGEQVGYYAGYSDCPAERLAKGLAQGFVYQGEIMPYGEHKARGAPSAHLPATAFVDCLQNHDQVGNRAFGERLTSLADRQALRAAVALLLLSPHIPMIFMGEETGCTSPFLFFTSYAGKLAETVREGRRREFAAFPAFADPERRQAIPDSNAPETFERSRPLVAGDPGADPDWLDLFRCLLAHRRHWIVPRLKDARALEANAVGPKAVLASWLLGGGRRLTIATNLDDAPVPTSLPATGLLYPAGAACNRDTLPPRTTFAWLA